MCCTGWPNTHNIFIIFNATCQRSWAPGTWHARSGPNAHALAQQCCVNVAKRVQHHATSKMLHEKLTVFKFEPTSSNMLQHIATGWPKVCNMLCPTLSQDVALKSCKRLARPLGSGDKLGTTTNMNQTPGNWTQAQF